MPRKNHGTASPSPRLETRSCEQCTVRDICLPALLNPEQLAEFSKVVKRTEVLHKGDYLYRVNEPFSDLFAVFTGFFKAFVVDRHGSEQITGFYFTGEIMGLHALAHRSYQYHVVALNTSVACRIPYGEFKRLAAKFPLLYTRLHDIFSHELIRARFSAANLTATQKVATMLYGISRRFQERGYSPFEYLLPMPNTDIANRLRLASETVSRIFTRLAKQKIVAVDDRRVKILDMERLADLSPHNLYLLDHRPIPENVNNRSMTRHG